MPKLNAEGYNMLLQTMRKKCFVLIMVFLFLFWLTGCGESVIPEMTKDEMQRVGEYAAITLMKYDANHRSRLVELPEETVPEQKPSATPEPVQEPSGADSLEDTPISDFTTDAAERYDTMEEALNLGQGISVVYKGNIICDGYPTNREIGTIYVPAAKDSKLLALEFTISNSTGTEQRIDILSKNLSFVAVLNEKYKKTALVPVLLNDMSSYEGILQDGESMDVVLLFQTEEEIAALTEKIVLKIKNDRKIYTIQLQ